MDDSDAIEELEEFILNILLNSDINIANKEEDEAIDGYDKVGVERLLFEIKEQIKEYSNMVETNTCGFYDADGAWVPGVGPS